MVSEDESFGYERLKFVCETLIPFKKDNATCKLLLYGASTVAYACQQSIEVKRFKREFYLSLMKIQL